MTPHDRARLTQHQSHVLPPAPRDAALHGPQMKAFSTEQLLEAEEWVTRMPRACVSRTEARLPNNGATLATMGHLATATAAGEHCSAHCNMCIRGPPTLQPALDFIHPRARSRRVSLRVTRRTQVDHFKLRKPYNPNTV